MSAQRFRLLHLYRRSPRTVFNRRATPRREEGSGALAGAEGKVEPVERRFEVLTHLRDETDVDVARVEARGELVPCGASGEVGHGDEPPDLAKRIRHFARAAEAA